MTVSEVVQESTVQTLDELKEVRDRITWLRKERRALVEPRAELIVQARAEGLPNKVIAKSAGVLPTGLDRAQHQRWGRSSSAKS